jgi:hypothetical protein
MRFGRSEALGKRITPAGRLLDDSADRSGSFAPAAWPHDRSESQHTDDDQEYDERDKQHDRSAQFANHETDFLLFNMNGDALNIDTTNVPI